MNKGAQDGSGDGSGDGSRAGTGTRVETRRRTLGGNGDGDEDNGNGNEDRIGEYGREAKERKNRKIVVDSRWETGRLGWKEEKT